MLGMIFKTLKVKQITDDIGDHQILRYTLEQEWATLLGSRATLETNLVYAGHYKYPKDLFIDKTMFFL